VSVPLAVESIRDRRIEVPVGSIVTCLYGILDPVQIEADIVGVRNLRIRRGQEPVLEGVVLKRLDHTVDDAQASSLVEGNSQLAGMGLSRGDPVAA